MKYDESTVVAVYILVQRRRHYEILMFIYRFPLTNTFPLFNYYTIVLKGQGVL